MSIDISFGYKLPEDGDKGSSFFDDLEHNISRVATHNHDNVNSSTLSTISITNTTTSISSANWAAVAGKAGLYSQVVTTPGGITMGTKGIMFIDATTGDFYTLSVEQVTTTSFRVYINDNTIDLTAIYV